MGKMAYHNALELRLRELTDRIAVLRLRWEHMKGVDRLRCGCEIDRLGQRRQALDNRVRDLESEKDSLWEDIKADLRGFTDELPSVMERWMEFLDLSYSGSTDRQSPPLRSAEEHPPPAPVRSARS
jgi:hypothetical protein